MSQNKMLISDKDIEMIKSLFSDNDDFLRSVRNVLFGLPVSKNEAELVKTTFNKPEVFALMKKRLLPKLSSDIPVGQSVDLWTGIDLVGKSDYEVMQTILVRSEMIKMVEKAVLLLQDPKSEKINLDFVVDNFVNSQGTEYGIQLTARNRFIAHIEFQLNVLSIIAGQKTETLEEAKKRMVQNSSK